MTKADDLKRRALRMLRNPTEAENLFRSKLILYKIRFWQQHIIAGRIVDFYLPDHEVAIEIDGSHHSKRKQGDKIRTRILQGAGVKDVYRFTNKQVQANSMRIDDLLQELRG